MTLHILDGIILVFLIAIYVGFRKLNEGLYEQDPQRIWEWIVLAIGVVYIAIFIIGKWNLINVLNNVSLSL